LPRYWKTAHQKAEGTTEGHWRDFCVSETGTGQHVAQLHGSYMMMAILGYSARDTSLTFQPTPSLTAVQLCALFVTRLVWVLCVVR
jgi:hypothetical protein